MWFPNAKLKADFREWCQLFAKEYGFIDMPHPHGGRDDAGTPLVESSAAD